jgi:hypothetical protein
MRVPGTLACPMCHVFNNARGNTITEGRANQFGDDNSIWIHFLFSCGKHIWARPKDDEQYRLMFKW